MAMSLQLKSAMSGSAAAAAGHDQVKRFDTHQRIQHFLMMSSFITLALTGLPQRFSELGISQWWVDILGGLEQTRMIHRTAGLVMVADCIYHVTYLSYRILVQGKTTPLQMIPTPQDARDAIHMARYFLGAEPTKPRFGRYSYLEKFDYWAVFWGMAVIGGSGLLLMFHVAVTRVLPGQVLPLAEVLHGDEAILATGWIAIVHMFNAHLAPWVFPFNPAIFTGKLSRERYEEDHPLEYERMLATDRAATLARAGATVPAAAVVAEPVAVAAEPIAVAAEPIAAAAADSLAPAASTDRQSDAHVTPAEPAGEPPAQVEDNDTAADRPEFQAQPPEGASS